ncbi:MAG: voltage-gated chloride channel family protein [candidate division FCPU426 bacterium]
MDFRWDSKEHLRLGGYTLKWTALAASMAIVVGSVVAFFLWLLDQATQLRFQNPWLLYLLPLAGVVIVLAYQKFGGNAVRGNNLVMDEIHEPGGGVPFRLAPLVLFGTVGTHLFGGSAGREGTAVQIGGSLSSRIAALFRLPASDAQVLMMAGVAAGFGAVFGTPLAGAVFAMEVLALGAINYRAILPCLIAGVVADRTCAAWGIQHTDYHLGIFGISPTLSMDWILLAKVALAGILFGLASVFFAEMNHGLSSLMKRKITRSWIRPVVGGLLLIGLTFALGTRDYLGLGVRSQEPGGISILSSFVPGGVTSWSWLWKAVFTAITLSAGFIGGEVTPLFFIGAALGNTLAVLMGAPVDLFAGLGFVAVFAGATNTPLACTLMGVELFGGANLLPLAIACFVAFLFSGHSSIYLSQRLGRRKGDLPSGAQGDSLRQVRDAKPPIIDL